MESEGEHLGSASHASPPAVVLGDLTLIRPLAWAGVRVVLVTSNPDDVAIRSRHVDRHHVVPGYNEPERPRTAAALLRLGERLADDSGCRVPLFYGQDAQLALLYHHREALEPYFLFLLNDRELAWALFDKERFSRLCESRGVLVPRTRAADGGHAESLRALRPPLLVKPRVKADWKGIQNTLFDGKGKARIFESVQDLLGHPGFPQ